jgi:ATP-binding protein involved in chromosome partitioning
VPVIGLVENMSGFTCPHCGESSDPFGSGGAQEAAQAMDIPFLGRIPLDSALREASDAGTPPAANWGPQAEAFEAIAGKIIAALETAQARNHSPLEEMANASR